MRTWTWFIGSRMRVAGALSVVALVGIVLATTQANDDGPTSQVDAGAGRVDAGAHSTTTHERRTTTTADQQVAESDDDGPQPKERRSRARTPDRRSLAERLSAVGKPASDEGRRRTSSSASPESSKGPESPGDSTTTSTTSPTSTTTSTTTPPRENGAIVFVDRTDAASRIAVVDGDGEVTRLTEGDHVESQPVWSPDGTAIAFTRVVDDEPAVFVMRADGSELRQLTTRDGGEESPSWSPDGSTLAFVADGATVAVVDVATGATRAVARDAARDGATVAWSPDGSLLAWESPDGIAVAAPDGSGVRSLTDGPDGDPTWSPDGTRLLVHREGTVVTVALDGSVSEPIADGEDFENLAWSPDGSMFLYDCVDDDAPALCSRSINGDDRSVVQPLAGDGAWLAVAEAPTDETTTTTTSTTTTTEP